LGEIEVTETVVRCAIYTRKSSEEGLEQSFNSLDAQREACEAYIQSQQHEGWRIIPAEYDDGGFSGGNLQRPALKRLLDDITAGKIDTIIVYKVDRLTRSLADFAKIVEQLDQRNVSFVSVTQQFNTTTSMGRLTLNVLLSFAQFEREVTGERIRDKIAASKRKGMWMGGVVPIGYDLEDRRLIPNPAEGATVNKIFEAYVELGCVSNLQIYLEENGLRNKRRVSRAGNVTGGTAFGRGALYELLQNRIYLGEITHKGASYPGQQPAIIKKELWEKVQAQLRANPRKRRGKSHSTPSSLLIGLLYDAEGNQFTRSHTLKKGKRYDYYVSKIAGKSGTATANGRVRLPAKEINRLVLAELDTLLRSPQRLIELLQVGAEEKRGLLRSVTNIHCTAQELLAKALKTVIVSDEAIEIKLGEEQIRRAIGMKDLDGGPDSIVTLQVPGSLQRSAKGERFVLPPDPTNNLPRRVPSLIQAVGRANDWVARMVSGRSANSRAIATETGHDERYVSRILPLAFLAPDLTEAILEGAQAPGVHLIDFLGKLPLEWAAQRESFWHADADRTDTKAPPASQPDSSA
jgi:site-specific DNA recombinase